LHVDVYFGCRLFYPKTTLINVVEDFDSGERSPQTSGFTD
jgi:hypothetical protein